MSEPAPHDAASNPPDDGGPDGASPDEAELARQAEQMVAQILDTPVEIIARAHAAYFGEVAAVHLTQQHPDLVEARTAIDGMVALVDGLNGRIANEDLLRSHIQELQAAYVDISQRLEAGQPAHPAPGDEPES